jgi:glycosyltransferase involved in cell wall biosynthesis
VRLAILAPGNSIHTIKWVNALANRGHQVHLLTMHKSVEDLHENIAEHLLHFPSPAGYYLNVFLLRRLLNRLMPDFLHAHYASGYGTLARLSRYKPLLLSVWGSDVYDFPEESCLNKYILRKNLASADRISSTSHCMKIQAEKYMKHKLPIEVIPFGGMFFMVLLINAFTNAPMSEPRLQVLAIFCASLILIERCHQKLSDSGFANSNIMSTTMKEKPYMG